MELKKCTKCGETKEVLHFGKKRSACKVCMNEYNKKYYKPYYEKNKEEIKENTLKYYKDNIDSVRKSRKKYRENNKEEIRRKKKEYNESNKDEISLKFREYYIKNKSKKLKYAKDYSHKNSEKIKEYKKEYYKNNKDRRNNYSKVYYATNEQARLTKRLRSSIRSFLKNKKIVKNFSSGINKELSNRVYLRIGNKPEGDYQLDHIIPINCFDLRVDRHRELVNHPNNLRWITSSENCSKKDKIYWDLIENDTVLLDISKEIGLTKDN